MPKPRSEESKEDYIKSFMESEEAKKDYPDEEKRLSVANSMFENKKEEDTLKMDTKSHFCHVYGLAVKTIDEGFIVKGYVATSHLDSGFYDESTGKLIKDKISKDTLALWGKEINDGIPRSNKVSIYHDRSDKIVVGAGIKGTAKLEKFTDGEYGLYVESIIDDTHPQFPQVKRRVELGTIDSFSIEYKAYKFYKLEEKKDYIQRTLLPGTELHGYSILSRPMNEKAIMVKSLISDKTEITSSDDTETKIKEVIETEKIEPSDTEENKEDNKMSEEIKISKEDADLLVKAKQDAAQKSEEAKFMTFLETKMKDDSFKKDVLGLDVEKKTMVNPEEDKPEETPEQKKMKNLTTEFKSVVTREDLDLSAKFREVGLIAEKAGLIWAEGIDKLGYKASSEIKPIEGKSMGMNFLANGTKLEVKSLGITTNQNSDTDYLLSSAELRDMFDPVIYDALNLSSTTWALLKKEDFSNKGNNQIQFTLQTGENAARGFYTGNAVSTGQSTRLKMQTKFKKYQVGISVDGDMIAAARGGPIGDVFALEVEVGTMSMIDDLNAALFAEVGLETASAPIGFEFITDSAGNTTMYNLTRSTTNKLSPDSAADTYINGSSATIALSNLGKAIEQATTEGADIKNLFFVTHPTQERLYKDIYRAMQFLIPTSSRFGFEGRPSFDGVPIFADKSCNNDDWFLVDNQSHKIGIWVPPTLEMLGKRSDADEGFIKTYYGVYNTAPRRMVQIYGNATS